MSVSPSVIRCLQDNEPAREDQAFCGSHPYSMLHMKGSVFGYGISKREMCWKGMPRRASFSFFFFALALFIVTVAFAVVAAVAVITATAVVVTAAVVAEHLILVIH